MDNQKKIGIVVAIICAVAIAWWLLSSESLSVPAIVVPSATVSTTAAPSASLSATVSTETATTPPSSSEFEQRKKTSMAAVVTTCGPCTDNIYGVDCIKDDQTYTCVAGTWVNFGKKSLIIASVNGPQASIPKNPLTSDHTILEDIPTFSNSTSLTAFVVCPVVECNQRPSLKGWVSVQDAIASISRIDPSFSNNVVESNISDIDKYASANTINGLLGLSSVRMENGKHVISPGDIGSGFWVTGQKPTAEWISFMNSKGIGIKV